MSIKNVLLGATVLGTAVAVVGGNQWSFQTACWANIAQYGMVRA